ncbi:hypothetical protein KIL84_006179 [Mauremys mutica]|uniref:Uncharacterized protein n=1 Tax=Mauremys mutica TaxID=74926 RepID=A0A9D3X0G7_9SAUR|nr:hypothetical protein KIL84_006179 [Mauremys mutica]
MAAASEAAAERFILEFAEYLELMCGIYFGTSSKLTCKKSPVFVAPSIAGGSPAMYRECSEADEDAQPHTLLLLPLEKGYQ